MAGARRSSWYVIAVCVAAFAVGCTQPTTGGGGGIIPNQAPNAIAAASPVFGAPPLTVGVDGSLSSDPDGTIVTYEWNWGDGSPVDTGVEQSHEYAALGTYTVTLLVTDDDGATDFDSVNITVAVVDDDQDGYDTGTDCDDTDPAINPGAADPTDDAIDQNCDGVDGDAANAVFVRADGTDGDGCGTLEDPCATIGKGQDRATAQSRGLVLVAGGTYPRFTVQAGLEVRGGYGQNFRRPGQFPGPTGSTLTTVQASFDAAVNGPVALRAANVNVPTVVADMTIAGGTAAAGQTSYGAHISNSTAALLLDSLEISGGTGGAGSAGTAGSSSPGTAAAGSPGENSHEQFSLCNDSDSGAGGAGAGGGGRGGDGGTMATNCWLFNHTARPGDNGQAGSSGGGAGGSGGAGSNQCLDGTAGSLGAVVDGSAGTAGTAAAGTVSAGTWAPAASAAGGTGTLGQNGKPGGGGGGGGGCDSPGLEVDDWGGGGGGGGAGGTRAPSAGTGGAAGRASIALFLTASSPTLVDVELVLGTGGAGGAGGSSGTGQNGGPGGAGGLGKCNDQGPVFGPCQQTGNGGAGGAGGAGGRGGHSGGGGGGAGGPAIGLLSHSSTPTGTPTTSGGTGGAGGAGGAGPVAGSAGASGPVVPTLTL